MTPQLHQTLPLKALKAIFRPGPSRLEQPITGVVGGSYACTDELQDRWAVEDGHGVSRLQRELARIRDGGHKKEAIVDLRGAGLIDEDLSGLDLTGADLRGADLSRADLRGTRLFQADLQGTVLFQAQLDGADLTGANMHSVNLESASLVGTSLGAAKLCFAMMMGAKLDDATLSRADLTNADMRGTSLRATKLLHAVLVNTDFTTSDLRDCVLNHSDVSGACFDEADMRSAHLHRLVGYKAASWIGADVREVDFAGAQMTRRFIGDQNYIEEFRSQSDLSRRIYYIWWLTSDCGRSMMRWGGSTMVVAMMFALGFEYVDIDYGAHETWYSSVYFSMVTLTTLGYGDVTPVSPQAQLLVTFEVIIGYLMLGGIISILSNLLARRAD